MMMEQGLNSCRTILTHEAASDRIASIVRSRCVSPRSCKKQPLLQQVVDTVSNRSARTIGEPTWKRPASRGCPRAAGHEDDLKTVLTHLIDNATMPCRTAANRGSAPVCNSPDPKGPDGQKRLAIHIADSGGGISENNIHKVFDPFSPPRKIRAGHQKPRRQLRPGHLHGRCPHI